MPPKPKPLPFDKAYCRLMNDADLLAKRAAADGRIEFATLTLTVQSLRHLYALKHAAAGTPHAGDLRT